jgi:hypothetical protein
MLLGKSILRNKTLQKNIDQENFENGENGKIFLGYEIPKDER